MAEKSRAFAYLLLLLFVGLPRLGCLSLVWAAAMALVLNYAF